MYDFDYVEAFDRLLKYYYDDCPGRVTPLLLLYLAQDSKPGRAKVYIEEKIREPLDWKDDPEKKYCSPILAQFTKKDAKELAVTDPAGKHMLERWECNKMDHMSIVVHHSDEKVKAIRSCFQKRDEALGEDMKTRKALFSFVQGLERIPKDVLAENYLVFADMILKEAGVLKEREDYDLAMFEKFLLGKTVKGNVFVPQAKSPFVAATFTKANVLTESAGPNAEFDSMISYLIIKGNGCKEVNCTFAEKPFLATGEDKYDYIIMNRAAHNQYTQHSDWHECLKHVKGNMSDNCRFFGLVENKYLFAMLDKQKLFTESIANKELEMVILLPKKYGCSLVSLNKAKKNKDVVKFVDLYNVDITYDANNPWQAKRYKRLIQVHSVKSTIEVIQRAQSKIQKFFEYKLPETEGFKLEPLRKYLRRVTPSSSFCVSNIQQDDTISVITFDKAKPYSPFQYMADSKFVDTFSIYHSYYYLDDFSLIVNKQGALNALLYNGAVDPAYVKDVMAFTVQTSKIVPQYIINELRKPYVQAQLDHWSHSPEGQHSEDEILDLMIYIPVSEYVLSAEEEISNRELDKSILPDGFEIENFDDDYEYKIKKCLGRGGFGASYLATQRKFFSEKEKDVVLKEYVAVGLPGQESERDENHRLSLTLGDISQIKSECNSYIYLVKFIEEAETMNFFSQFPGCRIRAASDVFKYDETNTCYYVMDYYSRGTLLDEIENNGLLTELDAIERIMIPLARAVKTMHDNGWLHLDIKAANVLIDDDGYAVLGDLGISQQYDKDGHKITKGGGLGSSGACRWQFNESFTSDFHPELDIYSLAAMYYYILTGDMDHRHFDPTDLDEYDHISEESKNAIVAALHPDLETTPKDIVEFMRMLPGCQDLELPVLLPGGDEDDDELDFTDIDFDMDDLDLPDFDTEGLPTSPGSASTY